MGLQALLARRAPQRGRHRERRDRSRYRLCGRRNADHPRGLRRNHAAQPCTAYYRGTIRHAGGALSRPDRSWSRPRTRHRPTNRSRSAPAPGKCRDLPAGRPRAAGLPRRPPARTGGAGRTGNRFARPAMDPRVACSVHSSLPAWAFPLHSHPTLPRISSCRRCKSIGPSSSPRSNCNGRTRWWG
jgi:hypothetical protein